MPDLLANRIIVYTLPYCSDCRAVTDLLASYEIAYQEISIAQTPSAVEQMLQLNGGRRATPTICIGRYVLVEPDRVTLETALRDAGLLPASLVPAAFPRSQPRVL